MRDQVFLLPPDMREWLSEDHLVWFVLEIVDQLDRSALHAWHPHLGAGRAAYDPDMLLALLIYAYCQGVRSSRQIERLCGTDVAFRVLCAQDSPDHTTIARFRAEAGEAFTDLFAQVLMIAAQAGLGRFGTVAIDGTKIAANASVDANRGQEWLARRAVGIVAEAEGRDAVEDAAAAQTGKDDRSDRVGVKVGDRTRRAERIRAAAEEVAAQQHRRARADEEHEEAALARRRRSENGQPVVGRIPNGPHRLAEARAHLAREIAAHQAKLDRYAALIAAGKKPMGRPPVPMDDSTRVQRARRVVGNAEAAAEDSASEDGRRVSSAKRLPNMVANTTDPTSRIMPTRKGYLQGYNAHVAVTGDQLIVAVHLGQSTNDQHCFPPMMRTAQQVAARLHTRTGNACHVIGTVLADAGYDSDANLTVAGPDRLIALGKGRDQTRTAAAEPVHGPPPADASPREANRHRLRTPEGRTLYKRRGATVEPGIGNLKKILDRFLRRGLANATGELHLAATAFNLLKIHRAAQAT
ncbi:transposase [Sciscionella marina]|uniref:transposase n=1 Tax=Sciscionella marina TaxID=508770 RepID=UPI001969D8D4|nr:transposase [Sciscionella marina]